MRYTIQQLKDAINLSTQMNQVCKMLGINANSGANYKKIRDLCEIHNISLEHFDTYTFRKDIAKKKCSKCKKIKNKSEFWSTKSSADGLQGYCKLCGYQHTIQYHKKHKERLLALARQNKKKRVEAKRDFVVNLLKQSSCIDCLESDLRVLDFDHINPSKKLGDVSRMIWDNTPLKVMKKEIDKCDIRCSNCHRKRTSEQFNWYKNSIV